MVARHIEVLGDNGQQPTVSATPLVANPIVPPLTPEDTALFPTEAVQTYSADISPWIELGSRNPLIAAISRQVLNLEIAYANFCNVTTIIMPGPPVSPAQSGDADIAQYARAVQEALLIASRVNLLVQMPMCYEPGSGSEAEKLSSLVKTHAVGNTTPPDDDCYTTWDAWNQTRMVCTYNARLYVGKCIYSVTVIVEGPLTAVQSP